MSATTTVMSYHTTTQRLVNRTVAGSVVATYTFDAFGQRTFQGPLNNPAAEQFTYTGTGRLASYASSSVAAIYAYDASGQRTRSVVTEASKTTTTTYTYDGLNLLSLSSVRSDGATWSVAYLYDGQSRPYAGVYSTAATTTPFQLVTTDRGDVVELLDGSGARFVSYRYDDWGVATASQTATTSAIPSATVVSDIASRQPLRYAGYCYDEHSKLYYLSARSYDPLTRQFVSKDPAKADGEESAYQYCGGEPLGKVDPTGLKKVLTNFKAYPQPSSGEPMAWSCYAVAMRVLRHQQTSGTPTLWQEYKYWYRNCEYRSDGKVRCDWPCLTEAHLRTQWKRHDGMTFNAAAYKPLSWTQVVYWINHGRPILCGDKETNHMFVVGGYNVSRSGRLQVLAACWGQADWVELKKVSSPQGTVFAGMTLKWTFSIWGVRKA